MILEDPKIPFNRYHPVVNYVLRPIYKTLGGRYNPIIAENITGLVSYALHVFWPLILTNGYKYEVIKLGAKMGLIIPAYHLILSLYKCLRLEEEMFDYAVELVQKGHRDKLEEMVEIEFKRRKKEYKKSPRFYSICKNRRKN